jgi:hypothetical protein
MTTNHNLTTDSLAMFTALANDADNWGGTPLVECWTAAEKGNLTDLKRKKLIRTMTDDGCVFAIFTESGQVLAAELGFSRRALTAIFTESGQALAAELGIDLGL